MTIVAGQIVFVSNIWMSRRIVLLEVTAVGPIIRVCAVVRRRWTRKVMLNERRWLLVWSWLDVWGCLSSSRGCGNFDGFGIWKYSSFPTGDNSQLWSRSALLWLFGGPSIVRWKLVMESPAIRVHRATSVNDTSAGSRITERVTNVTLLTDFPRNDSITTRAVICASMIGVPYTSNCD